MTHASGKRLVDSLKSLPIVERWDCQGCGQCCHGIIVPLDEADLRRLREQGWSQRPEFRKERIVRRLGFWGNQFQLGKRPDGTCVFLGPNARCRIHAELGEEAKPRVCRAFPVQTVPLDQFAYVVLRRCCPAAAAGLGRPADLHRDDIRRMAALREPRGLSAPPPIIPGHRRDWHDTLHVTETLQRLLLDARYPMVRRVVHGLQVCSVLESCHLKKLDSSRLGELLDMLQTAAVEQSGQWFQERSPPGRRASMVFRSIALDYLRLHPRLWGRESWKARWTLLRVVLAVSWGLRRIPALGPGFPTVTPDSLERPLGHLAPAVLQPLTEYFEATAASKSYAILGRSHWPIVESFRALAVTYSVALWMLRFWCPDREPQAEDMIGVIEAIDRGQAFVMMAGAAHRWRVANLPRGDIPRLVAWYAR